MTASAGTARVWEIPTITRKDSVDDAHLLADLAEATGGIDGLNGHRPYYIISLFKVTYKSTIQESRNFNALFTKTLENSDTCD